MPFKSNILRIAKEVAAIQKSSALSNIFVAFRDDDVRKVRCLIIGPPETPYELGFFEFLITFDEGLQSLLLRSKRYDHKTKILQEYPRVPPRVTAITTKRGRTRFHPDIHADGSVDLSILDICEGTPEKGWSLAQTLESVLLHISSHLSEFPYGVERVFHYVEDPELRKETLLRYNAKVLHETIRISVIDRLRKLLRIPLELVKDNTTPTVAVASHILEWDPFEDLLKRRFLWYYHTYLENADLAPQLYGRLIKEKGGFWVAPFETAGSNAMEGVFHFNKCKFGLEQRYCSIQGETEMWEVQGRVALQLESPSAFSMEEEFRAVRSKFTTEVGSHIGLDLACTGNPNVWIILLTGRVSSILEGCVLRIKMVIPRSFPDEQPRVAVEKSLFHPRVSADGTLSYIASDPTDLESHVMGIVDAIEDESRPHDPFITLNWTAWSLSVGDSEAKRVYRERLRQSAWASTESV